MAVAILKAQAVNQVLGGAVLMPWEVDQMPDDWLEALRMFAVDLPKMEKKRKEVELVKEKLKTARKPTGKRK